ncbi:transposable element Tcb1 transposase [Trichonephila clavipes]|nr:transposable element Tcb1 transposase [Trichonephila clavipes]
MTIVFVWRPRGERLILAFALQRHTASAAGVMVWDVITYSTQARLRLIRGTMRIQRHVGRNQTTAVQICDRWMKESTKNRRGHMHLPQCTTSREDRQIVRMAVTDRSVTSRTVAQHIL